MEKGYISQWNHFVLESVKNFLNHVKKVLD